MELAPLRQILINAGEAAFLRGDLLLASHALGSGLSLPWQGDSDRRTRLLETFCAAWLETRPTSARLDVVLLMVEALGRRISSVARRRHDVLDLVRECLVLNPGAETIIVAAAQHNGIQEGELLR